MAKIIDRVALIGIIFLTFFLWSVYVTKNLILGILISLTLTLTLSVLVKPKERFEPDKYVVKLTTLPFSTLNTLLLKVLNPSINAKIDDRGFVSTPDYTLVLPFLKHSSITADELYKKSQSCVRLGYAKLVLILNEYDEKGYEKLTPYMPCKTEVVSSKSFVEALKKTDLLPTVPTNKKKKPKLSALKNNVLARKCAKYYLLSGLTMGFLAFFTPLTLYYLVFCTISLTLGGLCLLKRKEKKPSYFI